MSLLLNGDCLELMKEIEDDSVDLIFCDLPYATKKYSAVSCKWNTPIDLDKFWIEVMRIKKLNTPIFMTCTTKFGVDLISSAPKKCPFRWDIVWVKSASSGFLCSSKMPLRKHEMVYAFYEKLPFYDLSSHKHKFKQEYNDYDNKDGAYGVIKSQKGHPEPLYNPPLPTSIMEIKSTRGKHSTEKPVELMSWILKYFSKEGDVVLDPTMGSGSTGVSCKNMNRNFIGIERDEEIYDVAVERIENSFV